MPSSSIETTTPLPVYPFRHAGWTFISSPSLAPPFYVSRKWEIEKYVMRKSGEVQNDWKLIRNTNTSTQTHKFTIQTILFIYCAVAVIRNHWREDGSQINSSFAQRYSFVGALGFHSQAILFLFREDCVCSKCHGIQSISANGETDQWMKTERMNKRKILFSFASAIGWYTVSFSRIPMRRGELRFFSVVVNFLYFRTRSQRKKFFVCLHCHRYC